MNINMEYPVSVQGADGTTVWYGCGYVHDSFVAQETNGVAFSAGLAAGWDLTYLRVQPWDRPTASGPLRQVVGVRLSNTTGNFDCFAGVAIAPAAANSQVKLACNGSVVPVRLTAAGTIQDNVVGSTTDGRCTGGTLLATAPNGTLGKLVMIAGATGPPTDSGSASYGIVAINIS